LRALAISPLLSRCSVRKAAAFQFNYGAARKEVIRLMQHGMETWKQLENIHHFGYSYDTVFNDFLDVCLSSLLSLTDNMQYPDFLEKAKQNKFTGIYEDRYMAIVRKYKENVDREHGKRPCDYFAQAWAYLQKETRGFEQDVLGDLYMEYISRGQHGQFFTPMNLTDMMAQIVGGKDGKTMSDPACGSGRTLISMSKVNSNMRFVGVDLDPTCAKMTALNMWLFDLNADIYQGDSLKMEMHNVWRIRKGGWIYEAQVETMPEPVRAQVKIQAQQTLFDVGEYKKKAA
jgi:hypothetical protein